MLFIPSKQSISETMDRIEHSQRGCVTSPQASWKNMSAGNGDQVCRSPGRLDPHSSMSVLMHLLDNLKLGRLASPVLAYEFLD